jgi:hypothetical protein
MTVKESLDRIVQQLPEQRQREVLHFAEFLTWQEERAAWQRFGQGQLARAYGPSEPDYTRADIKPERCS